jgi:hypothetical protein
MWRRWIGPAVVFAVASGFAVAGWIVWSQMVRWQPPPCPDGLLCPLYEERWIQAHPQRAELLWAIGALFAIGGCVWTVQALRSQPPKLKIA